MSWLGKHFHMLFLNQRTSTGFSTHNFTRRTLFYPHPQFWGAYPSIALVNCAAPLRSHALQWQDSHCTAWCHRLSDRVHEQGQFITLLFHWVKSLVGHHHHISSYLIPFSEKSVLEPWCHRKHILGLELKLKQLTELYRIKECNY